MKKVLIAMIKVVMYVEAIGKSIRAVGKESGQGDEIAIRWLTGIILGMIVTRSPLGILVGCVGVIIYNCSEIYMAAKSNDVSIADVVYSQDVQDIIIPIVEEVENKYRPLIKRIMEM